MVDDPKPQRPAPQRHDRFIRRVCENPELADMLVRYLAPEPVASMLSDKPVVPVSGQFVGSDLRESRTDLLFEAWTVDDEETGFTFVVEHKSSPYRGISLQLLRYKLDIWARDLQRYGYIRPIVVLVIYNGLGPWNVKLSVYGMLNASRGLVQAVHGADPDATTGFTLLNLMQALLDGSLPQNPDLRSVLLALLASQVDNMSEDDARRTMAAFTEALQQASRRDLIMGDILNYVAGRMEGSMARLIRLVPEAGRYWWEENMATLTQSWYDDGLTKGRAEGGGDVLLKLLEWRFGEVPEGVVAQIRVAGIEDIDRWVDAVPNAKGLGDIFGNGVAH